MSDGFLAVNAIEKVSMLDEEHSGYAMAALEVTQSFEEEDGNIDNNEIQSKTAKLPNAVSNTPKKRAPKAQKLGDDGLPLPKTPAKKAAKAPLLDDEGNPVKKTPAPRKPAAPKLDANGNPIPKTPRKKPEPKFGGDGQPIAKGVRKIAPKKSKFNLKTDVQEDDKMAVVSDVAGAELLGDESFIDGANANDNMSIQDIADKPIMPATPAGKGKKAPAKARVNSTPGDAKGIAGGVLAANKKKRNATDVADENGDEGESPTKKKKPNALPTTWAEASEADRLLITMKKEGKSWAEIIPKWAALSGTVAEPKKSTLSVRYSRIVDNLTEWKEGDIEIMLHAKEEISRQISQDIETMRKQKEGAMWTRINEMMTTLGCDNYSCGAIEKTFNKEKKENFPHRDNMTEVVAARSEVKAKAENADGEAAEDGSAGNTSDDSGAIATREQSSEPTEASQDGCEEPAEAEAIEAQAVEAKAIEAQTVEAAAIEAQIVEAAVIEAQIVEAVAEMDVEMEGI